MPLSVPGTPRPVVAAATDRVYGELPEFYRHADATQTSPGYPLLRFLALIVDELGAVEDLADLLDYTPTDDPEYDPDLDGTPPRLSHLTDPATAAQAWLPWLAQLVGVDDNPRLPLADRRNAIADAASGWRTGTRAALATAAKPALSGERYVDVYPDPADPWRVYVATQPDETADAAAVLAAVEAANVRPAGVTLAHTFYAAAWDTLEALDSTGDGVLGTWDDIEALGSWSAVERVQP